MRGFEFTLNLIVIGAVAVLVLVLMSFFFTTQATGQQSNAQANEIFIAKCAIYKKQQCDWKVTYGKNFTDFYNACKQLNGPEIGKFTCLYRLCCASSEDVQCDGLCELCNGNEVLGTTQEECCQRYQSTCSNSPSRCGVCEK